MNAITPIRVQTRLQALLDDIAIAADTPADTRHQAVAEAIAPHLGHADLLEGHLCPPDPRRYVRHLLHADPRGRYAVVAIVWMPGQMSPVHGHRAWCALGVHRGWLAETWFRPDGATPQPTGCRPRGPGSTSCAPAERDAIHRLANLGTCEALSIHVYGASYDSFGHGVNEVYAA